MRRRLVHDVVGHRCPTRRDSAIRCVHEALQIRQVFQHQLRRNAKINQAGNFVNASRLDLGYQVHAMLRRSEQGTGAVIAREGMVQQGVHVFGRQWFCIHDLDRAEAVGCPALNKRRKRPCRLFDEVNRGAQVVLHRAANRFTNRVFVFAHKRVQHQGDMSNTLMARFLPCRPVEPQFGSDICHVLPQQVCQQMAAHLAGLLERLRIAGGCEPDR